MNSEGLDLPSIVGCIDTNHLVAFISCVLIVISACHAVVPAILKGQGRRRQKDKNPPVLLLLASFTLFPFLDFSHL